MHFENKGKNSQNFWIGHKRVTIKFNARSEPNRIKANRCLSFNSI